MNKKLTILAAAFAMTAPAFAEGYQVNSLSARQTGMGHTGVALKLGSESMFFNPGALSFLEKNIDFNASYTMIKPNVTAKMPDGTKYDNMTTCATPIAAHFGMKVYDNFAAGISFYTPYGSKIDWSDNWPGAELNQRVKLQIFTVQPTFSWKILPNFSVGAGVMVTWGNVDMSKGLVSGSSLDMMLHALGNPYRFGDTTPASVGLKGNADVAVGANIGALWDINEKWSVGASWRSQQTMKVRSGEATVTYANDVARTILEQRLNMLHQANFRASMPAPWVLNFGVSYKPIRNLVIAADAQLTGWHAYQQLDIEFLSEQVQAYNQNITKNYKNSWTVKLGAQYDVTKRFCVRAGLMIDQTPVNKQYYNPETPGATKIEPSVGLSFFPVPQLSIDASVLYVHGIKTTGSCTYPDILLGRPTTFTGVFQVNAWAPSIGLTLHI